MGGGFAAAEESVFLTKYARHVTILIRGEGLHLRPGHGGRHPEPREDHRPSPTQWWWRRCPATPPCGSSAIATQEPAR